jgi:hypothetical protein
LFETQHCNGWKVVLTQCSLSQLDSIVLLPVA